MLLSLSLAKHICWRHNVAPLTDIITVNAGRSKVAEGELASSNHSQCICEDQELPLSSARLSHFKLRRCLCVPHWFVLFAVAGFAVFACRLLLPVNGGGNKKTCARCLWCINKRLLRLGELGMEGRGGEEEGGGGLYQSASSSTQPCKWGSGYQSHSPASLSEWS